MPQSNILCEMLPPSPAAARQSDAASLWVLWLAVVLAIGPFIVRRIILLGDDDYLHWMAIDYAARCLSLVGVFLGLRSGLLQQAQPQADWPKSLRVFLLLFAAQYLQQSFGYPLLEQHFRFFETVAWPPILDPTLRAADVSLGLLFAVFVEEMVFRKFLFAVIERWLPQKLAVITISATAFALVHFTSGVADTMLNAFVHGLLFGIAFWTTRRLSVCVVSHYLIDVLIFSGR